MPKENTGIGNAKRKTTLFFIIGTSHLFFFFFVVMFPDVDARYLYTIYVDKS